MHIVEVEQHGHALERIQALASPAHGSQRPRPHPGVKEGSLLERPSCPSRNVVIQPRRLSVFRLDKEWHVAEDSLHVNRAFKCVSKPPESHVKETDCSCSRRSTVHRWVPWFIRL